MHYCDACGHPLNTHYCRPDRSDGHCIADRYDQRAGAMPCLCHGYVGDTDLRKSTPEELTRHLGGDEPLLK